MRDAPQLKRIREERALSQRDLASMSGVAHDSIGQIERGERKARPSTVRKLAGALGVEPSTLLAESETDVMASMETSFNEAMSRSLRLIGKEQDPSKLRAQLGILWSEAWGDSTKAVQPSPSDEVSDPNDGGSWMERYVAGRGVLDPNDALHLSNSFIEDANKGFFSALRQLDELKWKEPEEDDPEQIKEFALFASGMARAIMEDAHGVLRELIVEYEALPDHYYEDPSSAQRIAVLGSTLTRLSIKAIEKAKAFWGLHDEALKMLRDEAVKKWVDGGDLDQASSNIGVADLLNVRKEEAE